MTLLRIEIYGIFDHQDIEIDLSKSPFFLVGPNGTGKSTALKIFHNFLSAQWSKLDGLPFLFMQFYFNDDNVVLVERADFKQIERLQNYLSRITRRPNRPANEPFPLKWATVEQFVSGDSTTSLRQTRRLSANAMKQLSENYENLVLVLNFVETFSRGKVLYFPTYRRVEKDLRELLEEDDPFGDPEDISLLPELVDRFTSSGEVVGFGGQDISALLDETTGRIELAARQSLNDHSVKFLEALSGERSDEAKRGRDLVKSSEATKSFLKRIASFSNIKIDLSSIEESISEIRVKLSKSKPGRPTQSQEMMLLYVGEMLSLLNSIDEQSVGLRQFAKLIDSYLRPIKTVKLDSLTSKVVILDADENEITPEQLSSGEKQILAFFAFLILKRGNRPRFIIIDEPELSLSVSWQKTLIRDILSIGNDPFLISATHSPFIFESFPIDNIVSLGDL